jgi:glycosyltransferase involved in cell wall biosynthesis
MADSPSKGRPLKVALFSDSALPVLNGVSVSVDALMRALRDRGHSVHLWTTRYPGHRETDPNTRRLLGCITPLAPGYPLAVPPFYPWFHDFQKMGFDIVHCHTPWTVGFVGLRWAEACGVPVVATYHTHYDRYSHYVPVLPQFYVRYKIAKHTHYFYNRVKAAVTPSRASERWLKRHNVLQPIHVIPTGIPPPRPLDRVAMRGKLGISPGSTTALYVGRLAPEKNLQVMLESVALAMEQDPALRLIIVGDGPMRQDLISMSRALGIGSRVRVEGAKPREKVDEYYAACDLFVFCSVTETQGLVVMEAMSYGLPAVLAAGGGASDPLIDGVNGCLCHNDPDAISKAILRVCESDRLPILSQGARKSSRRWSIDQMTERILGVYGEVLGRADLIPQVSPESQQA